MDNNETSFAEQIDRFLAGESNHGLDEEFSRFCTQLVAAKPEPDEQFKQDLNRLIQAEKGSKMQLIKRSWFTRVAVVLVFVLVMTTAVYAIDALLQRLLSLDPGLHQVNLEELGTPLDLSQTIDNITVTLQWAYADENRVTIGFIMEGDGAFESPAFNYYPYATLSDMQGNTFNITDGRGYSGMGEAGAEVLSFDTSTLTPLPEELALHFEAQVSVMTEAGYATLQALPTPQDGVHNAPWDNGLRSEPIGPFKFDFTVSTVKGFIVEIGQTVTHQNIAITLDQTVISPSSTRLKICFPENADRWTVIPSLLINNVDVMKDGSVTSFGEDRIEGTNCHDLILNGAFRDRGGLWQLKITELVIFGEGSSRDEDQTRIKGDWIFNFQVAPQ